MLAIEPMVNAGTRRDPVLDDGWTVVTADGRRSAHFEHTIAVTDHGPEVLTLPGSAPSGSTPWAKCPIARQRVRPYSMVGRLLEAFARLFRAPDTK